MIPGLGFLCLVIWIIGWCRIASRAGYGAMAGLLCVVPIVNVIAFLAFAFGEWPIHKNQSARVASLVLVASAVVSLAASAPGPPPLTILDGLDEPFAMLRRSL